MDYSLAGSSVHGISQAGILEGVVISFSRGSPHPRNQTRIACIGRQILYTTELPGKPLSILYTISIVYTCQSQSLNSSHPLHFPRGINIFVLYVCDSIPV